VKRPSIRERLFGRTRADGGCLVYTGSASTQSGHRQIWFEGRMRLAHRVAWQVEHGQIPDGLCVLHRCDNPPCVNLDHLWLGTVGDNNADRDAKGRGKVPDGDQRGRPKIKATMHGTLTAYRWRKCRCAECLRGMREYRARRRSSLWLSPQPSTTPSWRCRRPTGPC
jgi:hypothetical protein